LYQRVTQTLSQLKRLPRLRLAFVFGFAVYESFESARVAKTGHAGLPKSGEAVHRRTRGRRASAMTIRSNGSSSVIRGAAGGA